MNGAWSVTELDRRYPDYPRVASLPNIQELNIGRRGQRTGRRDHHRHRPATRLLTLTLTPGASMYLVTGSTGERPEPRSGPRADPSRRGGSAP